MISNLPEVPPNWIKVRFDEIAENITDRIDKPKESGLEYYIGLEHLDTDQIRIKRFGSTDDVEATKFLCKKGDIIFGKRNAYLRKVAVTDRDAVVSAHSMVIRSKGNLIVPDFLPCFMQSSVFWKTAHAISEGSMSPTIKWKTLSKQEFWIPSIEEQKKIIDIIWNIQDNIQKAENIISIYEKLNRGLLNELLSKGIGHTQFKKTDIGEIPDTWTASTIGESCSIENNLRKPIDAKTRNQMKGSYPYYGPTEIIDYINEYRLEGKYVLIGEDGDHFLKYKDWSMTQLVVGKFNVNNHAHVIRGINNCSTEWIFHYFRHRDIISYLTRQGVGRYKLKKATLVDLPLAVPPMDEQEVISNIFDNFDTAKKNTLLYVESLKNLKKKLTDKFLKGEVQV